MQNPFSLILLIPIVLRTRTRTSHHITVAGFRRLNRARIQIFKGDDHAMKESRIQLRAQIEANKSVPTSGPVFEELVKGLDEAAQMLSHEIVRGDLNEDTGRYGTSFLFVLRIFLLLFSGPVSVISRLFLKKECFLRLKIA